MAMSQFCMKPTFHMRFLSMAWLSACKPSGIAARQTHQDQLPVCELDSFQPSHVVINGISLVNLDGFACLLGFRGCRPSSTKSKHGSCSPKLDEILAWEKQKESERDTRFVDLGRYLCEVRAGQYWRVENLKSFDEFLERRFPESRRKAYYLMSIHELHTPLFSCG